MLVTVKECGAGVNKDLLASELAPGVWSDSMNVRFRSGFARPRLGTQAVFTTPAVVPYFIQTYSTAASRFLVECGTAKVYVDDGSAQTDITPASDFTGTRDDRWTGGDFNGTLILNNGVEAPCFWNGDVSGNLATLTSWPVGQKVEFIGAFKDFIVWLAPTISGTKYPYRVGWSNAAEPGSLPDSYTASATNQAGDKDIIGIGKLVGAYQLGDVYVIYGTEGRFGMQYIGGNDVFRFFRLPGKDGLLARGCVADTPRGHVALSNGDVLIHQGGQAESIADGVVRKWIFDTIDTTNAQRAFLTLNPQETEVWVVFPSANQSDCDRIAAWNWKDNTWGIFSCSGVTYGTSGLTPSLLSAAWSADGDSWDSDVTAWDQDEFASNQARTLLATSTPRIGLVNTGSTDFGSAIDWHLEKTGISLDDPDSVKFIKASRPHFDAVAGAQVTVKHAATMNPDDAPIYNGSATFTVGTSTWANQFSQAGRYAAIRFEGTVSQASGLRSYDLDLGKQGRF